MISISRQDIVDRIELHHPERAYRRRPSTSYAMTNPSLSLGLRTSRSLSLPSPILRPLSRAVVGPVFCGLRQNLRSAAREIVTIACWEKWIAVIRLPSTTRACIQLSAPR